MAKEEFKIYDIIDSHPPEFRSVEKRRILFNYLLLPILGLFVSIMIVFGTFNFFSFLFLGWSIWYFVISYRKAKNFEKFIELDKAKLQRFADFQMIKDTLRFKRLITEFDDSSWGLFSIGLRYIFVKKEERIYMNLSIDGLVKPLGFLPEYLNIRTKNQKLLDRVRETTAIIPPPKAFY
jgi:hypothetical protein